MKSSIISNDDVLQRGAPSDPRHATSWVHQLPRAGVMRSEVHPVPGAGCVDSGSSGGSSTQGDDDLVTSVLRSKPHLECLDSLEELESQLEARNAGKVDGQCWGCLVTFKGSRGLKAHLARSKTCKNAANNSVVSITRSVPVQRCISKSIVVPEPGVPGSSHEDPVAPSESSDSHVNKRLAMEEEAASLRAEDEVRLSIKWPALKEKAKWSSFQSAVLALIPAVSSPWTARLDSLQSVIYSVGKESFGCIQPGSGQKPKKNRRMVKLDLVREEIRLLVRRLRGAPQEERYPLEQLIEEKKLERNSLRRAENGEEAEG